MRFKARIWRAGSSNVITVPAALDIELGESFLVTLEKVENGQDTD